ncbi:MAG: carboxypeptidase regulatory-like domain-containing protein [Nitrospirae bacterium]|nr:carboxypeptidase regulatory-like domain-containing protein [Nitrospirota bacterium]
MLENIFKIVAILIVISLFFGIGKATAVETTIFKGHVFDVEGDVVKGTEIFIYNSPDTRRPADFISGRTEEDGYFSITLPFGKYWAVARLRKDDKYGPLLIGDKHSGEPVEIEVEAGKELVMNFTVVDIRDAGRLSKKTGEDYLRISGRIIAADGKPVKQVYAVANRTNPAPDIPDFLSAWTDMYGRYTLYLPKGKYYIGYDDEFPMHSYRVYKELIMESDKDNFDIVVESK